MALTANGFNVLKRLTVKDLEEQKKLADDKIGKLTADELAKLKKVLDGGFE